MYLGVFIDSFDASLTYFFTHISKDDARVKCVGYSEKSLVCGEIPVLSTKGDKLRLVGTIMSVTQFSQRYCETGTEVLAYSKKPRRRERKTDELRPRRVERVSEASPSSPTTRVGHDTTLTLEGWNDDEYAAMLKQLQEEIFGKQTTTTWSEMR